MPRSPEVAGMLRNEHGRVKAGTGANAAIQFWDRLDDGSRCGYVSLCDTSGPSDPSWIYLKA